MASDCWLTHHVIVTHHVIRYVTIALDKYLINFGVKQAIVENNPDGARWISLINLSDLIDLALEQRNF